MRLFKRNTIWWLDVTVNGQRYRLSLDTTDKRKAKELANDKIAQAKNGKLTAKSQSFARLAFGEAADKYEASRALELSPSSQTKEKQLLVKLREFFQAARLTHISSERVLEYREWRAAQGVGPRIINMEIGVLRRILKRAKLWYQMADDIKPLKEPETIGKALSEDERQKLITTAALKPEWETAYLAALIALNTTMRGCELRARRWEDLNPSERTLTIHKGKTRASERVIPLNEEAYDAILRLYERAQMFGPVEPSHYIFATFKPVGRFDGKELVEMRASHYDPTRPIGSWKKAWRKLTVKAGLKGLRFHDLRHHAITELCESGQSDQTIMAIAGHVSERMLKIYSHIRLKAKREAVEVLSRRAEKSNGTNHGTKTNLKEPEVLFSQIKMVGACGFEPQTPTVSR